MKTNNSTAASILMSVSKSRARNRQFVMCGCSHKLLTNPISQSFTHNLKPKSVSTIIAHMLLLMVCLPLFLLSECKTLERDSKLFFTRTPALPETTLARLGDKVILRCEAGGSPAPEVYWLKDGKPYTQSVGESFSNIKLANTIGQLVINDVKKDSLGEYTCVAEHQWDKITSSTLLLTESAKHSFNGDNENIILNDISIRSLDSFTAVPAYVSMWIRRSIANNGEDVTLYCRASGLPKPRVDWYNKYGEHISQNKKYQLKENGDLKIYNVDWTDMGHYMCRASNPLGSYNATSFFYPLATSGDSD